MNVNRVTFQQNKEFIMFIFLFNGFIMHQSIETPPPPDPLDLAGNLTLAAS